MDPLIELVIPFSLCCFDRITGVFVELSVRLWLLRTTRTSLVQRGKGKF